MPAFFSNFLAFLRIVVPIVEAVLLVGVNVPFLFLAAAGDCQRSDQDERDMYGASSSHVSLHAYL